MDNLRELGMLRVAVVTPEVRVGDIAFNLKAMLAATEQAAGQGAQLVAFPELAVTGYTCADLFFQQNLIEAARRALQQLATAPCARGLTLVVGVPVEQSGRLFNVAAVVSDGRVCGLVPKTWLPNSQEFYEERWFSSSRDLVDDHLLWDGEKIPFGTDLLFTLRGFADGRFGVEICEDGWALTPPSAGLAAAGATLLVNLSASPEILGKCAFRRNLVASHSARCLAAYLYASAGPGESSTDLVFSGHSLIAENGLMLAETERFRFDTQMALADIDMQRLVHERLRNNSYGGTKPQHRYRTVEVVCRDVAAATLLRPLPRTPFVPDDADDRDQRCREIFAIQTTGLMKRLVHTGSQALVLGISGGLDSTLALLVAVKAFDRLGWSRQDILAVTMPGFGTTRRTRDNAIELARQLGVTLRSISIEAAVRQHFADIGHDPACHDIVFENAQARERTRILMDLANQAGGLVVGTGDLSELALGWATYNGDHMSMYGVNASIPKTLVRSLIAWCAETEFAGDCRTVLHDVCDTPVSPELLPPDAAGEISQKTEEQVGPYELHDFFLFQAVRCNCPPRKVLALASRAFAGVHGEDEIRRWLQVFYRRFFAQQFKRSCLPDGPKVGSVALSPRGDWRMPSDASATLWLSELQGLEDGA